MIHLKIGSIPVNTWIRGGGWAETEIEHDSLLISRLLLLTVHFCSMTKTSSGDFITPTATSIYQTAPCLNVPQTFIICFMRHLIPGIFYAFMS